jgi:glycosyltransferase 2 family protein
MAEGMKENDASRLAVTVAQAERPLAAALQQRPWVRTAKLLFSAAVLILLAFIVDWAEFATVARSARLEILLLAAGILVLGNVLIAWRWKVLLEPVGIHTTLGQALRSYLKGHFLSFFVPSGMTADVVKALDMNLARTAGRRKKVMELASSIFIERGFGAITVGMAVALGLMVSPLVGEYAGAQQLMAVAAGLIIFCCMFALYADKLLVLVPSAWIRRWPRLGSLVTRARDSFAAYRSVPGTLLRVMLLSVAIQGMRIIPVYVIAVSIGLGGDFFPFLIAVPLIFLSNMIPVVGSRIGTEQGLFVLLLGLAGVPPEAALTIALLSLVLGILTSLPGGYWLMNGKAHPVTDESAPSAPQ